MCSTCFWTVRELHPRISPISRLRLPAAIHSATSSSRLVSEGGSETARALALVLADPPFREGMARSLLAEHNPFVHTHNGVCRTPPRQRTDPLVTAGAGTRTVCDNGDSSASVFCCGRGGEQLFERGPARACVAAVA